CPCLYVFHIFICQIQVFISILKHIIPCPTIWEKVHPALRVFILIAEDIDGLQAPAIANGKISIGLCPITPFPNIRQHDTDESSEIIRIVIQVFLSMNITCGTSHLYWATNLSNADLSNGSFLSNSLVSSSKDCFVSPSIT